VTTVRHERQGPLGTSCDFCGVSFTALRWNGRTCPACAVLGAPDQGTMTWIAYQRALSVHLRGRGRRRAPVGAARRAA
jgi:hypothetical protein